jgi:plastocyanin
MRLSHNNIDSSLFILRSDMKNAAFVIAGLGLLMFGAGCYSSPVTSPTPQPVTPQAVAPAPVEPSPTPAANQKTLSITNFTFEPSDVSVNVGTNVVWVNRDAVSHTITSDDGSFDSGPIAPGSSFTHSFMTAGTFPYHCTVHPSMHGTVTVQ